MSRTDSPSPRYAGKILRIPEVAAILGVSPSHIRKLLRTRVLQGTRLGRVWLIPGEQLDTVFEQLRRRDDDLSQLTQEC